MRTAPSGTATHYGYTTGGFTAGRLAMLAAVLLAVAAPARAKVTLPNIFGDHMVLQCDKPVHIWGWAGAGEKVTVTLAGQNKSAVADARGNWSVRLDAMKGGFDAHTLVVHSSADKQDVKILDVLVGELWLCGGQSNMEYQLRSTRDADVEMACVNYPAIRFIRLPHVARMTPQRDFRVEDRKRPEGSWRLCVPGQADTCTGVGYYFARRLHRRLKVPVGLIDTSWGGTMAQHWVPAETLRKFPEVTPYFEKHEAKVKAWKDGGGAGGVTRRYEADVEAWKKKLAEAKAAGGRLPRKPSLNAAVYRDPANQHQPGGMFNGMIAPLAHMTIRGVLFYQGENNSFTVGWKPFPKTFPAVIAAWRKAFGDEKLPFGIIQIAGWSTRRSMTYDMNHHTNIVREVQFLTWRRTPGTGLIVTFDTNTDGGIHPSRKQPVGQRSARWALAEVYHVTRSGSKQPLQWRGPVYTSMTVKDGKAVISFAPDTSGALRLDQDDECGFTIAGADRTFHHARARVAKGTVQVWSEAVPAPVAVRYGWSNLPTGGLMNSRELPAYPFRTDTWPLVPHQSTGAYEVSGK